MQWHRTVVGIDLGLNHFAVLSDGRKITAPQFLRRAKQEPTRSHTGKRRDRREFPPHRAKWKSTVGGQDRAEPGDRGAVGVARRRGVSDHQRGATAQTGPAAVQADPAAVLA